MLNELRLKRLIVNICGEIEACKLRAQLRLGQYIAQPTPEPWAGPAALWFIGCPRDGLQSAGERVDRCMSGRIGNLFDIARGGDAEAAKYFYRQARLYLSQ